MGFFVTLFNCLPNKPSTNVIKRFMLEAVGSALCLIVLFFPPEK